MQVVKGGRLMVLIVKHRRVAECYCMRIHKLLEASGVIITVADNCYNWITYAYMQTSFSSAELGCRLSERCIKKLEKDFIYL